MDRRAFLGSIGAAFAAKSVAGKAAENPAAIASEHAAETVPAFLKVIANEALSLLLTNLVVGNLVHRNFEPIVTMPGDTINCPVPPLLVHTCIAEPDSVRQAHNLGNAVITMNRDIDATFSIPDLTITLEQPELLRSYMLPSVLALTEQIETDLLALHSQFVRNAPAGTPGAPLTESAIDAAETALFAGYAPRSGKYLIVSGAAYADVRRMPRFTDYNNRSSIDGADGQIKEFRVFRSAHVRRADSIPVTTHNLAFARDAIGLIVGRLPEAPSSWKVVSEYAQTRDFGLRVDMGYHPNGLAQQFTIVVFYGCGVLRNSFGVQVNS